MPHLSIMKNLLIILDYLSLVYDSLHLTKHNLLLSLLSRLVQDSFLHIAQLHISEPHLRDKNKIVLAINALSALSSHCDIENTAYVLD